jgi:subtilisin family serine protease
MNKKEYIVSLNRNVDYDKFWEEIENISSEYSFVPSRRVEIINNRDGSLRSCHYSITDEEAELLRKDPRVYSVEIPPDQRTDIKIGLRGVQSGNFTKTSSSSGNFVNWGLKRINSPTNIYGTSFTTSDNYDYVLDGRGVDVVIQDSGIEVNHPEFQDSEGQNRVQTIDWYTESGLPGTQNANHYRDYDGHGTHVAGIVAGKTFGWAKNSRIYSIKVRGLEGPSDDNTGIAVSDCFDVIKLWHRNKPVDPRTGFKRPTIVNMSWGYFFTYQEANLTSVTYRGNTFSDSNTLTNASYRWSNYGIPPLTDGTFYYTNFRVGSVDIDLQELLEEGIHVIISAGNQYHKIDIPGGDDYNNYMTISGTSYEYHRGSSPSDENALKIGSLDTSVVSANEEQKAGSSETGPGVDLYACGANVMSSCSNINVQGALAYSLDSGFKQVNIGGTSMAAPQVCGVAALYLQMSPGITPQDLKRWLINNSAKGLLYDTNPTDYANVRSLLGGNDRMLYNPFGVNKDGNLRGEIVLNNAALTLE